MKKHKKCFLESFLETTKQHKIQKYIIQSLKHLTKDMVKFMSNLKQKTCILSANK